MVGTAGVLYFWCTLQDLLQEAIRNAYVSSHWLNCKGVDQKLVKVVSPIPLGLNTELTHSNILLAFVSTSLFRMFLYVYPPNCMFSRVYKINQCVLIRNCPANNRSMSTYRVGGHSISEGKELMMLRVCMKFVKSRISYVIIWHLKSHFFPTVCQLALSWKPLVEQ